MHIVTLHYITGWINIRAAKLAINTKASAVFENGLVRKTIVVHEVANVKSGAIGSIPEAFAIA